MCKAGKSCGVDGVPYELLQCIMQTSLAEEFIDFFNSVLDGSTEVPQEWLDNKVFSSQNPGVVAAKSPQAHRLVRNCL